MFATKVGPIETDEGPVTFYLGFTEKGCTGPVPAPSDAKGLEELLAFAGGKELRAIAPWRRPASGTATRPRCRPPKLFSRARRWRSASR